MKKLLAFTLTVTLAFSVLAGMFTVADAKALSELPRVPLNYMDADEDWKAATSTTHTSPVAFAGTAKTTDFVEGTRVTGGNEEDPISAAKAADDTYFKLVNNATGDKMVDIIVSRPDGNWKRYELKPGNENVITVSMDVAVPNIADEDDKWFISGSTGANETTTTSQWDTVAATLKKDGTTGNGTIGSGTMQNNKWYNVTYEVGSAENEKTVKYFLNGEEVGATAYANGWLGSLRTGFKGSKLTNNTIYYDNVYINVGEPYTMTRYVANKDAAALNFTHFKGDNTAKDAIKSNLNLTNVAGMSEGTTITWASSEPAVLDAATGTVTPTLVDTDVTLTATITNDGKSNTKAFSLKVPAKEASSEEVEAAKAVLKPLLDANADKTQDGFTADSFAAFTAAKEAAQTAYDKADVTVTELVAATDALTLAVDGLVMPAEATYGVITNDAFTQKGNANATFNTDTLTVKGGYNDAQGNTSRMSYVGVDMTNISPAADKIVLKLYFKGQGADGTSGINENALPLSIYKAGEFDETTLKYSNRPVPGDLISTAAEKESEAGQVLLAGPGWLTFDVTDYALLEKVKGNNALWLAFSTAGADNVSNGFWSKEAADATKRPIFEGQNINLGKSKDADLNAIDIQTLLGGADDTNSVTQDLKTLPAEGSLFNHAITWISDKPEVLDATGKVTRPAADTEVTLTASVNEDGVVHTKEFKLTVARKVEQAEIVAAKADLKALIDANTDKTAPTYTEESIAAFTGKKNAAQNVYDNADASLKEVLEATEALAAAVDGLVMPAAATYGTITNDAHVQKGQNKTFNEESITVKGWYGEKNGSTARIGYIGVDMTNISPAADKVVLKLYYRGLRGDTAVGINENAKPISVYEASAFDETTLMHSNRPQEGALVSQNDCEEIANGAGWLTLDVTDYAMREKAKGNDSLWLAFTTADADNVSNSFWSKEAADEAVRPIFEGQNINLGRSKDADLNAIDMNAVLGGADMDCVIEDLNALPTTGSLFNYAIEWDSDNAAVINAETGKVTRPAADTEVTLTAAIKADGVVHTKEFKLTVPAYKDELKVEKPSVYYAAAELNSETAIAKDGVLTSKVHFANLAETGNENVALVLAVYSANGAPLDVKFEKVTVAPGIQHKEISLTLSNETENIYSGSTVKAFVWDDNGMTPVSDGFVSVTKQAN